MQSLMAAGVLALASVGMAAPAAAATQTVVLTGDNGTLSGAFERPNIRGGNFTDLFNFTLPEDGTLSAALVTISTSARNNINFTSAFLTATDGSRTNLTLTGPGRFESGEASVAARPGPQSLTVNGFSGGNGSYSGVISFEAALAAGVPEPAMWAFLMLGFGAVGGAMRRRAKVRTRVVFA